MFAFCAPLLLLLALSLHSFSVTDRVFSRLLDDRLPVRIRLEGVRWKPLAQLRFQTAAILSKRGRKLLNVADGEVCLEMGAHGPAQRFILSEFSLPSDIFRSFPAFALEGGEGEGPLQFRNAAFTLEGTGFSQHLRILSMSSSSLEFRGSVWWEKKRLEKVDLLVLIPPGWTRRLPESLAERLSTAGNGKKILKCAYRNNQLTFYGASGPLLRAAWSPEGWNAVERG